MTSPLRGFEFTIPWFKTADDAATPRSWSTHLEAASILTADAGTIGISLALRVRSTARRLRSVLREQLLAAARECFAVPQVLSDNWRCGAQDYCNCHHQG